MLIVSGPWSPPYRRTGQREGTPRQSTILEGCLIVGGRASSARPLDRGVLCDRGLSGEGSRGSSIHSVSLGSPSLACLGTVPRYTSWSWANLVLASDPVDKEFPRETHCDSSEIVLCERNPVASYTCNRSHRSHNTLPGRSGNTWPRWSHSTRNIREATNHRSRSNRVS